MIAGNDPSSSRLAWNVCRVRSPRLPLAILLMVGVLIYLPGLNGPYLFDDHGNLLANVHIQLQQLTWNDLYSAAFSLDSGPLRRPISVLSFALNYWLAGGFGNPIAFKTVNLAIHLLNGVLVFVLIRLLLERAAALSPLNHAQYCLPGLVAFFWTIHPIQLTSVLYVVQRMTSLAALFTLAALCVYLLARRRLSAGRRRDGWLLLAVAALLAILGVFSKETAVLFPLYVAVVELAFYHHSIPGRLRRYLGSFRAWLVAIGVIAALGAAAGCALAFFEPRFAHLSFTMEERLLTQFRVVFFYLSLLLLPQLPRFGLYHDDIVLSTAWFAPWTTAASFVGILLLVGAAFALRRREPLISLGVLWFFAGHSLESTVLPLEIAHEHRNYLPSLGIILALSHALTHPRLATWRPVAAKGAITILATLMLAAAATTAIRATHWSDIRTMTVHEVLHHPRSASAHAALGAMLASVRQPDAAIDAFQEAARLNPEEPAYLLLALQVAADHDKPLSAASLADVNVRLRDRVPSAYTRAVMGEIANCLPRTCRRLAEPMIEWTNTLIAATPASNRRLQSYWSHILGRTLALLARPAEALAALEQSHELDPHYLHPLFEILQLHVAAGDRAAAEHTLARIERANAKSPYPRDRELLMAARMVSGMGGTQAGEEVRNTEHQAHE